eukprot:6680732-Ditylum_brightwellii.AAC.1
MAPVYDYLQWLKHEGIMRESYITYRRVLQIIQARNLNKRLVLKCPSHALSLQTLIEIIPEAKIIFIHRNDIHKLAASEVSLITRLQAASVLEFDWWRTSKANMAKFQSYSENM